MFFILFGLNKSKESIDKVNWKKKNTGICIHLRRLVYLSKEEFKFLRLLRLCFLKNCREFFEQL